MFKFKQLNKDQKQWLFENGYITAKVLDACVEPGWQDYFINCFNWVINEESNNGWYHITLASKDGSDVFYHAEVNLKKNYTKLMEL